MAKIPSYILAEEYNVGTGFNVKIIPKGSFLKPIREEYVPPHVHESAFGGFYNKQRDIFCYTYYGIVPIPKNLIIEVN